MLCLSQVDSIEEAINIVDGNKYSLLLPSPTTHRIRIVKPSFAGDVNFDGKYVFFGRFLCEFCGSKSSH
ncbi:hypothetical protein NC653_003057 [Populus alba x Populus x berolinensis]|uniref:Uncharacterized protein n=1 Tax=Populus alba x Populus x berolinensis TaxID=444605 RepID=A0AAD6RQG3_9ROSI|nr:hypothetical protein NC653_003056 [Populus alba x Populus x berolinensis]KAJ7013230.1 hypothetical protein NC653_003057 [Populus alba x Populus x berolinensis]